MLTINPVKNSSLTYENSHVTRRKSVLVQPSFKGVQPPVQLTTNNFFTRLVKIFKAGKEIKQLTKIDYREEGAAQKMVDIALRIIGMPEGLVKVGKELPQAPNAFAEFSFLNGRMNINSPVINQLPELLLSPYIFHELDHFAKAAKTCKMIGLEKFERIVTSNGKRDGFDRNFWRTASEHITVSKKFDAGKNEKALTELLNDFNIDWNKADNENIYNYLLKDYRYITNLFEESAHKAQYSFFNPLKHNTHEWIKKPFSKVESVLDNIVSRRNLGNEAKPILFQQFYIDTLIKNDRSLSELLAKYNANPTPEALKQFQEAFAQRSAQLNSNILNLPLKEVLKDKADMLNKTAKSLEKCTDADIIRAYTEALNAFRTKVQNPGTGVNRERYINLLRENTSDFLNFMTENKYEARELLLNLRINNAVLNGGADLNKLRQLPLY